MSAPTLYAVRWDGARFVWLVESYVEQKWDTLKVHIESRHDTPADAAAEVARLRKQRDEEKR